MPIITRICETCGKEFFTQPSEVKKGWGRFCSQQCHYDFGRVTKTCQQCSKSFHVPKNQVAAGGGKFCSRKCTADWQSEHTPKEPFYLVHGKDHPNWVEKTKTVCHQCGKTMEVLPWQIASNKKYCSAKCYGKAQNKRVERHCAYCGKSVYIKLRKSRPNPEKNFCNTICYVKWRVGENNPAWTGGYEPYYGDDWNQQQRAARKRDNYTCQQCGKTEKQLNYNLDVHHIVPRKKFNGDYKEANRLSNLVSLCKPCHRKQKPR